MNRNDVPSRPRKSASHMKRRDFLKSASALAAASVSAPAVWSPAKAQARNETLLIVTESGPNNIDIHGVGTNRPGYEVSWNCYDRLITYGSRRMPTATTHYDCNKFKPELAEDWNVGDMSVTFKLRKDAKFHDGTPVTAKDVKWSFDRAVTVGGFPTFQMKAGSLEKPEQFVVVDDHTFRVDFLREGQAHHARPRGARAGVINSELVQEERDRRRTRGRWNGTKNNMAGGGAYKVEQLDSPARKSSSRATTTGRAARCRRSSASSGA